MRICRARALAVFIFGCAWIAGCGGEGAPTAPTATPTGGVLQGQVRESGSGVPVPRAAVRILDGLKEGIETTSDAAGRYRFEGVPLGSVTVAARAEGFLEARAGVDVDGTRTLDFTLRPVAYASLSGRVTGELGAPLVDATVIVVDAQGVRLQALAAAATGEYRFNLVQLGQAQVTVTARGFQPHAAAIQVDGPTRQDFVLHPLPQVSLSGRVSDIDTGAVIAGATVRILDGLNAGRTTTTGSGGDYRFDNVIIGSANLAATAPGYAEFRGGTNVDGTNRLDLALRRTPSPRALTGRFNGTPTDPSGCVHRSGGGRFPITEWPCQEFAFTARRTGAVDVTVTWQGTDTALYAELRTRAGRVDASARGAASGGSRVAFSHATFPGENLIRIVNFEPRSPIPFTVTYTLAD